MHIIFLYPQGNELATHFMVVISSLCFTTVKYEIWNEYKYWYSFNKHSNSKIMLICLSADSASTEGFTPYLLLLMKIASNNDICIKYFS